ncbi:multiprotein bridging factor 1 [Arctopsyche grandis]|uniref:multiprotein bridging factor 1 n=1 Tax=Arctopsyche grandis TaxID=121162 RepID=UPI00406D9B16
MSDWEQVGPGGATAAGRGRAVKTESAVNAARRQGVAVDTQHKFGGGSNRQHQVTKSTAKLDRETELLKHDTVTHDLGKLMMQARQAKGMSQKDLATKICEKPQIVNDYEAGRGLPNNLVIGKIERALGVKLRGKDRGTNLPPPGAKK